MPILNLPDLASVLLALPDHLLFEAAVVEADVVTLHVRTSSPAAPCPVCRIPSDRVHSHYARRLTDLAAATQRVHLVVDVRRFRCGNAACARAIFAERLPAFAGAYARRTVRAAARVGHVGLALGGEAGARLLRRLGTTVSADTVLRHVDRLALPAAPTPRVLGVDAWAMRRGHTYGTLLVDLERRRPVDVLPDRETATFARWLVDHPGVEVIARDRAEVYAEGGRRGAPAARQVADRWHLLKNVGDVLERVLHAHRADLAHALSPQSSRSPGTEDATTVAPNAAEGAPKQALYDRIHALHAQGCSLHAIAEQTQCSRPTVRKYLRAPHCPTRAHRATSLGTLAAFEPHLRTRWAQGQHSASVLWRELRALGFHGARRTVQHHVGRWPVPADQPTRRRARGGDARRAVATPPSPRRVKWWLLLPSIRLTAAQQDYVARLTNHCPAIRTAQDLAVEFGALVRAKDVAGLGRWLDAAAASEHAGFRDFVVGLRRDRPALEAAVEGTWSNGQTEGQVNKLKMLKRQMYGRAGVALIRQRMVHTG